MKKYAGIGSRETPKEVLLLMEKLAERLGRAGWMLRSGAAPGADSAFEKGCDRANGKKEIFLPWRNFEQHPSGLYHPTARAVELAKSVIPWWDSLTDGAKKLHSRNAHQILGYRLDEPVDGVVYWTDGGGLKGGTATALKIAKLHNIKTFWLRFPSDVEHVELLLRDAHLDCPI